MSRPFRAVLHCTAKEFEKVHILAGRVIAGLTDNDGVFASPNPSIAELTAADESLADFINKADKGDHKAVVDRNVQSAIVHAMLNNETRYVNTVANGDQSTILLSGFDASNEPVPHPIPDKVVIKRIEDGPTTHSAKIFIMPAGRNLDFTVQTTTTPNDETTYKTVLATGNSKQLLLENLVRGQEIYVRINARNAAGTGDWSDAHSFIAR